jgi:predicted esterase
VGFHEYQGNAPRTLEVLRQIAGSRPVGLVSIQGLSRVYNRAHDTIVASWMTKEDRELVIADNIGYVGRVLTAVAEEFDMTRPLIYVGFSQGVAMAYRAAAFVQRPCAGIIALAGDVPPDVAPVASSLPPILLGRGSEDKLYSADQFARDLEVLAAGNARVTEQVFEGVHDWAPGFISRSSQFVDELLRS